MSSSRVSYPLQWLKGNQRAAMLRSDLCKVIAGHGGDGYQCSSRCSVSFGWWGGQKTQARQHTDDWWKGMSIGFWGVTVSCSPDVTKCSYHSCGKLWIGPCMMWWRQSYSAADCSSGIMQWIMRLLLRTWFRRVCFQKGFYRSPEMQHFYHFASLRKRLFVCGHSLSLDANSNTSQVAALWGLALDFCVLDSCLNALDAGLSEARNQHYEWLWLWKWVIRYEEWVGYAHAKLL